jgi:homocysteine S-methyltransferase
MKNIQNPLIFDGAMGTYYNQITKEPLSLCELANIQDPKTILQIHKEYLLAGAKAIRTNTFGANFSNLDNDEEKVKSVIEQGVKISREATKNTEVLVFGSIGPIALTEDQDQLEEYKKIISFFLEAKVNYFVFETFSQMEPLQEVLAFLKKECKEAYVLVEFAISPEGYTRLGKKAEHLILQAINNPHIDACGFNCYSGPYHLRKMLEVAGIQNKLTEKTFSIMPNAGYPTIVNNRTFFDNTKEYFADQMMEIAKKGVTILGGCCGTTPEYIKELCKKQRTLLGEEIPLKGGKTEATTLPLKREESLLWKKLQRGEKVIAVELDPPLDTKIDSFMEGADFLKGKGVDAITIADCPIARARVDSSLLACKLKRELDITPIPHMTCRDRNINATKALLLGLQIEGVNDVLVVTGDPIPSAQRDEIKAMFSFNSAILAGYINNLNEEMFKNPFTIYGALNVNAKNFHNQLKHAKKKIENGVSVFLTQPIFTQEAMDNLKRAKEELPAKILGGIIPIVSYRNACFMQNEISGIEVSQEIIDQYKGLEREEASKLAVTISTKIAKEMSPYIDGYYLITPFKRVDLITDIISNIRNIED